METATTIQTGAVTMPVTNNTEAQPLEQNTLIFVKSHSVGTDSKGREKIDLRFSEDESKQIREELSKFTGRIKLQVHIGETSAFMFVKEVQEKGEAFIKGAPKAGLSANTKAKLAAFKSQAK
jgi:hypothetical protein